MIKLCGFPISNYYNKVKLALLEKGIPFTEEPAFPSQDAAFLEGELGRSFADEKTLREAKRAALQEALTASNARLSRLTDLRAHLTEVACGITGGGLDPAQWAHYITGLPYQLTCP